MRRDLHFGFIYWKYLALHRAIELPRTRKYLLSGNTAPRLSEALSLTDVFQGIKIHVFSSVLFTKVLYD